MTFGEKVKELRVRRGFSQETLASMTGVTTRTVRNWETEGKYPRSQDLYPKLAAALDCNEEYLRGEQELFMTRASEEYGTRGQQQAQAFLDSTRAMFAGGDLSPEDLDMIGKHFMEMFWEAKENAKKYTPKKYRNTSGPGEGSTGPASGSGESSTGPASGSGEGSTGPASGSGEGSGS